ncbi:Uma2 family endonuclease [Nocardia suismassiliense]|uniref:Uma2 family endonuclease n=1 Tax=Nocardia suismassiliense TaxID=2077092 RepID=A0ABW6QLD3_9NOCA
MAVRAPLMSSEEFEELARAAARIAEGLRLEFVEGKLGVKPPPDGNHSCVMQWLIRLCLRHRPELWLSSSRGLAVGDDRTGRARPDGTLAAADAFVGKGEWANADPVLMVVDVTSHDEDTNRRHRTDRFHAYAATGIPVYLLIDRDARDVAAYSEPSAGRYTNVSTVAFGAELPLPKPVDITLDTEPLEQWVS